MAKTRSWLASVLSKLGNLILGWLSGWENKGIMPGVAGRVKIGLLGVLASLVMTLSLPAHEEVIMCYAPAPMPDIEINDISVTPNPTAGADSVKVKATARIFETWREDEYINNAHLMFYSDTVLIPMYAVDGKYSDTLEVIEGDLLIKDLEPGTTWVYLSANSSQGGYAYENVLIYVTEEPESAEDVTDPEKED